jgi:glycosyltransferase involved in cell wall biosynthesis
MAPYLSIVVPLYDEEESLERLYDRLKEALEKLAETYEIIFIDDGSKDQTWSIIERLQKKDAKLRGIKFRRNFGQTSAMVAGFNLAEGRIIITMDGDLQNDPGDIPLLLEKLDQGYDIVSGWRKYRKDHFSRVWPSNVANKIISWTTGVRLHDYGCSLKAYRAECIKPINAYGEMHRFFPALASMTGARIAEIPVKHEPRKFGVSKYGFGRIFGVFSDIFAMNLIIRFSDMPLKGFTLCSIPFFVLAVFFGLLALAAGIYDWAAGKALFFIIVAGLTGSLAIHLVVLGVLAELVVETSDLSHTTLPEMTQKRLL